MKGKSIFTRREADEIRALIRERNNADASKQKGIRAKMRKLGFYGKDDWGIVDCKPDDFEKLIRSGLIKIL